MDNLKQPKNRTDGAIPAGSQSTNSDVLPRSLHRDGPPESPTVDELAAQVNDLLPLMAAKLLHFTREVPGTGITIVQGFLLRHLKVHGPCTASGIGDMLGITSGPVTTLTKRLIAKGLVERRQDPKDGRVFWFSLTAQGDEVAVQVVKYRESQWKQLTLELGVEHTIAAIQLMKDTVDILNRLM